MSLRRVLGLVGLVGFLILVVSIPIRAMMQDHDAGFTIDPRFESYFSSNGGKAIFGEPISTGFQDLETGNYVQYFKNARLELIESSADDMEVITSPLGMMLEYWEAPLTFDGEQSGCKFFHETGHYVCHAFLHYYENNGGEGMFGYPISEFIILEHGVVQFFQRFRLDWNPDEPDQPVRPGPLGAQHLSTLDLERLESKTPAVANLAGLLIVSSVEHASTKGSDRQTVYLQVLDQNRKPLQGAAATLIANFPEGERMLVLPLTGNDGRSQVTFDFQDQPPGYRVTLDITVVFEEFSKVARESFMIYLHGPN